MPGQRSDSNISARAAKCYREEQINGLSQKELILMLYDGAIKFAGDARAAIEKRDYVESYKLIVRGRDVVTELLRILDLERGGDVARNLKRLYVYMIGRLTEVNFTKEVRLLDNVIDILQNLRSAWADLDFDAAAAESPARDTAKHSDAGTLVSSSAHRNQSDMSRLLSVTA
jgi:flagellar protein FliS